MSRNIGMASIALSDAEIDAAVEVLKSGALRQGVQCDEFEKEFASKAGAKYAVTSANGSSALHLPYMTFIEPGDEVLVPSFTFIATGSMVTAAGGIPVCCDVDPETFLLDLADARKRVTSKTKAIAPVHLFGNACDIDAVQAFANEFKLKVVWDAAQAHGAEYNGQDIGSFGDFVTYSFYPSKNMFVGEGGITLTNSEKDATKMRFMRSHGQTGKYLHTMFGLNYRMTDVEAAIGRKQLQRLDEMLDVRRRNAAILNETIDSLSWIRAQKVCEKVNHAWHQYCVVIDPIRAGMNREELQAKLKDKGIATGVHYPRGMHQQPIFIETYGEVSLPATEALCKNIIALPIHHGLSEDDVIYIANALKELV